MATAKLPFGSVVLVTVTVALGSETLTFRGVGAAATDSVTVGISAVAVLVVILGSATVPSEVTVGMGVERVFGCIESDSA